MNRGLILVSGPSRSGKSLWAEKLIQDHSSVIYIATSDFSGDENWKLRIKKHQERRPDVWKTIEVNTNLIDVLNDIKSSETILIDSLGGFVSTYLTYNEEKWIYVCEQLVNSLKKSSSFIIIVIEETGWGVIPATRLGNLFMDRIGLLSQQLEFICNESYLIIHGRAINLNLFSLPIK